MAQHSKVDSGGINLSAKFLRDAAERAVGAAATAVVPFVLSDGVVNIWVWDWKLLLGIGLGGAALSVLKSLAARRVGSRESASILVSTKTEVPSGRTDG